MNSNPNRAKSSPSPILIEAIAIALLLALVCLIAWPGMKAPLLLDDLDQLAHVRGFQSWNDCFGRDSYGLFRPAKNLIFFFADGLSLFPWHALNLSAYLGAVVAVYFLVRRLLGSPGWALAAATLWGTCPTQVSTAIWMSAVNLSLAVIFTSLCLILHDHSQAKPGRNLILTGLAGLFLFLAQCSYETAVAVPGLCVLVDTLHQRRIFSRASILRYAMLGMITVIYLAIRSHIGAEHSAKGMNFGFSPEMTAWQLSLSAPWFLWKHFSMWLVPAGRIESFGTYLWGISAAPWELAAAWAWLLLLIGLIVLTWKRQPWVSFGLLWFLIASFPPSNFIPIWSGPIEDYYLVFPGIGLAIAVLGCAKALVDWINRELTNPDSHSRLIGGAILCVLATWRGFGILLFWLQSGLWCRPLELYLHCDLARPGQYQAQALAARELFLGGNLQQAKELALKSRDLGPWYGLNSMILGLVALESTDFGEAERRFTEVLSNTPPNPTVHDYSRFHLAKTFMAQDSKRQLTKETLLPLLNNPRSSYHLDAINLQLDCYLAQDQPKDAHRAATKAVQLHPDNRQIASRLADIEKKFPSPASK